MGAATEIDLKMYHTALREHGFGVSKSLQTLGSSNSEFWQPSSGGTRCHLDALMFLSPFWQPMADLAALCSH